MFNIYCTAVFFNLFAAAEPYVSVMITHRTPYNDLRVQQIMRSGRQSKSFSVWRLMSSAESRGREPVRVWSSASKS